MRTLMDKINHFESLQCQTVEEFNKLFTAKLENVPGDLEVEIGQVFGPDTCRWLSVGTLTVKHEFQPVTGEEKNVGTRAGDR
jgi:hypothetical protein